MLTEDFLKYDVDASWWVTAAACQGGYYEKLYTGLQGWLSEVFPFGAVYYSNKQMPGQD